MQLTRRECFIVASTIGSGLVLAACGKSKPGVTATVTHPSAGTPTGSLPGAVISGGPQAASAAPMSVTTAERQARVGNGHWQGGWHDDAGRSGTSDVLVAISPTKGSARATVSFTGPITGTEVPDTTYEVYGLLSFVLGGTSYDIDSPQFGRVHIEGAGEHSVTATVTKVPGHPEIVRVDVALSTRGQRSDLTYSTHLADGKTVKGTMAWSSGGVRATPAPLGSKGRPTPADVQAGVYAASLLTAGQLTTATGIPFGAVVPNGGRLFYTPTINVSDASAKSVSGRYSAFYSVYLGTPQALAAFWKTELGPYPLIRGPWNAGFIWTSTQTFYGYSPGGVFTVQIVDTEATAAPETPAATVQSRLTGVATDLAKALAS